MFHRVRGFLDKFVIGIAFCALGCSPGSEAGNGAPEKPREEAWFQEVSAQAGIDFQHVRARTIRYWLPEICPAARRGWIMITMAISISISCKAAI